MNKALKVGLLPLVLCLNSGLTQAAALGPYIGGGLGVARLDPDSLGANTNREFAGKGFVGYNFNRYLGLEGSYSKMNPARFIAVGNFDVFPASYNYEAFSFVGKLYLPLGEQSLVNLYGAVGAALVDGTFHLYSMPSYRFDSSETVATVSLGLTYDFNQHFTAGLELTGFGSSSEEYGYYHFRQLPVPGNGMAMVNLAYRF